MSKRFSHATRSQQTPLTVYTLGRTSFNEAWGLQKALHSDRKAATRGDCLLLVEHDPVITLGKGAKSENVLCSEDSLAQKGIELVAIERGGDVTYHGPGQLVAYPILDLNQHRRDVGWYMRSLEEVVIRTLATLQVTAYRSQGNTGVWCPSPDLSHAEFEQQRARGEAPEDSPLSLHSKIASIGVRLSRWCTYHGLALNVLSDTTGFDCINPCGFSGLRVTSVQEQLKKTGLYSVSKHRGALQPVEQNKTDAFSGLSCKKTDFSGTVTDSELASYASTFHLRKTPGDFEPLDGSSLLTTAPTHMSSAVQEVALLLAYHFADVFSCEIL